MFPVAFGRPGPEAELGVGPATPLRPRDARKRVHAPLPPIDPVTNRPGRVHALVLEDGQNARETPASTP